MSATDQTDLDRAIRELARGVAQATAELIQERMLESRGRYSGLWTSDSRKEIAETIAAATMDCAQEDPDSEVHGVRAAARGAGAVIKDSIEHFRSVVWHSQCARCGSSTVFYPCDYCDEDGFRGHDCGEDCCACLQPEPNVVCDVCMGSRGWLRCTSSKEWCEANPMEGREHVRSTGLHRDEAESHGV